MALRHASITFLFVCIASLATVSFASDSITALLGTPISVTGPDGVCKKVTNNSPTGASLYVPTTTTAEWQSFTARPPAGVTFTSCATNITVPCSTNVNLFTLAGSPSTPGTYIFTIPSGCVVGSNTTSLPALTTGNWPAGSSVTLINNGYIEGMGGAGGGGAYYSNAGQGGTGGLAMRVLYSIVLQNGNGHIYAGGGGGGGGESLSCGMGIIFGGGSGGVGQGYSSQSSPGAGGGAGHGDWGTGGSGGSGGGWAMSGGSGGSGDSYMCGAYGGAAAGGAGGVAITGSNAITWQSYGDVRGPVQ